MEQKKLWLLIGSLIVVVGGLIWWGMTEDTTKEAFNAAVTTYFWGDGCPHCKKVNEFLDANKVAEKVQFEKREVWKDATNARLMRDAGAVCNVEPSKMGVPFVFSEGKCYIGEPDVMGFFKQKAGL